MEKIKGQITLSVLAEMSGVSVGTIRHYQSLGLIHRPSKPQYGGFRRFSQEDLDQLRLIHIAQTLGFSLTEIGQFFQHQKKGDFHAMRLLIASRRFAIRKQIRVLESNLQRLLSLALACSNDIGHSDERRRFGEQGFFNRLATAPSAP